jgi:PAS domain-containing protein
MLCERNPKHRRLLALFAPKSYQRSWIQQSKAAFRELQSNQYIRYDNLPLETRSGRRVNVEFVSNVYEESGKSVVQCNIRDITARKRSEASLHESEQRLAGIIASATDSIISLDEEQRVVLFNAAALLPPKMA